MRASVILPIILSAGAIGHPHFKLNNPLGHVHQKRQAPVEVHTIIKGNEVDIEDVFVKTVYANGASPEPSPAPVAHYHAPEKAAVVAPVVTITPAPAPQPTPVQAKANYVVPSPQETNTPVPQPSSTSAPTPAPSSSNDGAPTSGGKSMLASANHFRALQGYPPFEWSSTLEGNAAKTNRDDGGNQMTHELNSGSFGQCIAQGSDTTASGSYSPFDLIYLGWLCEIPSADLGDGCAIMKAATNMQVNTADPGHANILRTAGYTKIGCNYIAATEPQGYAGLWTCDFA